jgi:chromosome segregation ATPase
MSEDQFQRHVEFIIEQQAKFETNIARLEEDITELRKENRENTRNIARLADVVLSLANHVERHDNQIAELIENGKETDRRTKETDERINALIGMAERFFNSNGN